MLVLVQRCPLQTALGCTGRFSALISVAAQKECPLLMQNQAADVKPIDIYLLLSLSPDHELQPCS